MGSGLPAGLRLFLKRALQTRFAVCGKARFTDLFEVIRELMHCFVYDSELLCVACAPHAETAVQSRPPFRRKRKGMIALLGGQANDFVTGRRDAPHKIRNRGFVPRRSFMIFDGKGHLEYWSA